MRNTNSDRTERKNSVSVPFSSLTCPPFLPHSPNGAGQAASQSRLLQEQGSGRQRPSQVGGKVQGRTPLTVGVLVLSVVLRSRKTSAVGVQGPDPTTDKKQPLSLSSGRCPPTR